MLRSCPVCLRSTLAEECDTGITQKRKRTKGDSLTKPYSVFNVYTTNTMVVHLMASLLAMMKTMAAILMVQVLVMAMVNGLVRWTRDERKHYVEDYEDKRGST